MKTKLWIGLAAAALYATEASAQTDSAEAITYFRSNSGAFERSVTMRFPSLPRAGDEIRAGANVYRVARVLFVIAGESTRETRLYFERVGPAERD